MFMGKGCKQHRALSATYGRGCETRTRGLLLPKQARYQLRQSPLVRPEGFEPPTLWSEAKCSNPLSYGRKPSYRNTKVFIVQDKLPAALAAAAVVSVRKFFLFMT